jgi:hypothetical protein
LVLAGPDEAIDRAAALALREFLVEGLRLDPEERARILALAAEATLNELEDVEAALELAKRALDEFPDSVPALNFIVAQHAARGDIEILARFYEEHIGRCESEALRSEIARRLLGLAERRQDSPGRALAVLERSLSEDAQSMETRFQCALLAEKAGDLAGAERHLRASVAIAPEQAEAQRRLFGFAERQGDGETAWVAASSLVVLGDALDDEQAFVAGHSGDTLMQLNGVLSERDWQAEGLRAGLVENAVSALLKAASDCLCAVEQALPRRTSFDSGGLVHIDPATSSATLARALTWTAQLLSLAPPKLMLSAEGTTGEPEALRAERALPPVTVVDRRLASGMAVLDLACLWGRHLVRLKSELLPLLFMPEPSEFLAYSLFDDLAVALRAKRGLRPAVEPVRIG